MNHLFKVELERSDMFIRSIDDTHIVYQVREKDTGKLMEAEKKSVYTIATDKRVYFDSRFIALDLFNHIKNILL